MSIHHFNSTVYGRKLRTAEQVHFRVRGNQPRLMTSTKNILTCHIRNKTGLNYKINGPWIPFSSFNITISLQQETTQHILKNISYFSTIANPVFIQSGVCFSSVNTWLKLASQKSLIFFLQRFVSCCKGLASLKYSVIFHCIIHPHYISASAVYQVRTMKRSSCAVHTGGRGTCQRTPT